MIIIAKSTVRRNGTVINGFGYLDCDLLERKKVYGDDIYYTLNDDSKHEMVGVQIQLLDVDMHSGDAVGTIIYGMGNDEKEKRYEGVQYKNVIGTNTLGPILTKNPWYTEKLIKQAMKNKGVIIDINIDESEYDVELNSLKSICEFISDKEKI